MPQPQIWRNMVIFSAPTWTKTHCLIMNVMWEEECYVRFLSCSATSEGFAKRIGLDVTETTTTTAAECPSCHRCCCTHDWERGIRTDGSKRVAINPPSPESPHASKTSQITQHSLKLNSNPTILSFSQQSCCQGNLHGSQTGLTLLACDSFSSAIVTFFRVRGFGASCKQDLLMRGL